MVVCDFNGKVKHETKAGAIAQARKAASHGRGRRRATLDVYLCPECQGYHVGHRRNVRARA